MYFLRKNDFSFFKQVLKNLIFLAVKNSKFLVSVIRYTLLQYFSFSIRQKNCNKIASRLLMMLVTGGSKTITKQPRKIFVLD